MSLEPVRVTTHEGLAALHCEATVAVVAINELL